MSEQEMNKYRFTSGQEPGDERLRQIMIEASTEAILRHERAERQIRILVSKSRKSLRDKWNGRINAVING